MAEELGPIEGQTYGTGQQIVQSPEIPEQLAKENPKDELPERVVDTQSGKVLNLDTGAVTTPEIIEISGMKIDASDFGDGGMFWLEKMYDQWLCAVETDEVSTYKSHDENGMNSAIIVEIMRKHYPKYVGLAKWRPVDTGKKDKKGRAITEREQFILWDRNTTLEQWIAWAAGTARWRITYEFEQRRILDIGVSRGDIHLAKQACENCVVTCEKFLAMSEKKRLTAI